MEVGRYPTCYSVCTSPGYEPFMCTCASSFPHVELSFIISQRFVASACNWVRNLCNDDQNTLLCQKNPTPPTVHMELCTYSKPKPWCCMTRVVASKWKKRAVVCIGFKSETNHVDTASNICTPSSYMIIHSQSLIIKCKSEVSSLLPSIFI